jgi:hypothetical protein
VNVVVPFPDPLPSSLVSGPSLKIDKFVWERPRPRNRANIAATLDDDLRSLDDQYLTFITSERIKQAHGSQKTLDPTITSIVTHTT